MSAGLSSVGFVVHKCAWTGCRRRGSAVVDGVRMSAIAHLLRVWMALCDRMLWIVLFFFQAEDGIRDIGVTGVQTCALPILLLVAVATMLLLDRPGLKPFAAAMLLLVVAGTLVEFWWFGILYCIAARAYCRNQIGRASCRERV